MKILACANCGSNDTFAFYNRLGNKYYIKCIKCGNTSATFPEKAAAISAWNNKIIDKIVPTYNS